MALQYSIPKMLLGVCSKSAAPGHNVSAAAARAAAKGRPLSSWLRSAAGNAALHSAAAVACKGGGLRGFGTERKGIAPQRGQQMYPGSGKLFCAGVGIGRRQRHHQVRPAASAARTRTASGRMGTPPRCTTPVLMHTAMVLAPPLPQHAQLQCVAAVERVIFCNDADKIHIVYP